MDMHRNGTSLEHFEAVGQVQCMFEFVNGVPQCKHTWPIEANDQAE